jgi:glycosyltransferase involved in cell wall biosynthesis
MTKILIIYETYPFEEANETQFVDSEIKTFIGSTSYELHCLSLFPGDHSNRLPEIKYHEAKDLSKIECIKVMINSMLSVLKNIVNLKNFSDVKYIFRWWIRYSKTKTFLRTAKIEFDLIYTFWLNGETFASIKSCTKFSISRVHGFDLYYTRHPQPKRKEILKKIDLLVTNSSDAKKTLVAQGGKELSIIISYLGVEKPNTVSPVGLKNDRIIEIVTVSTNNVIKRIDYVAYILQLLSVNHVINWHHFGERILLKPTNSQLNMFQYGVTTNREVKDFFQTSPAIFLSLSSTEGGVPTSLLEAASTGHPIIANATGGVLDFFALGGGGISLEANHSEVDVMESILRCWDSYGFYAAAARKTWMKNFNSKDTSLSYILYLRGVIEKSK